MYLNVKRMAVLVLVLVLGVSMPALTICAGEPNSLTRNAGTAWDGTSDISWYKEAQTEYVLTAPGQLAGLAQLVNEGNTFEGKKITLASDMYFNEDDSVAQEWTAIAAHGSSVAFQGTFDGKGHTLYNFYSDGLFGTVGEHAIVKAVSVSGGTILSGAAIAEENNGWILFCVNNSKIVDGGSLVAAGGICGRNNNMLYGCGNTGAIGDLFGSVSSAGGVCGSNAEKASIDSCWNQGEVFGHSEAGGIVTYDYGWIYDCYNSGNVTANRGAGYAGGIIAEYSGRNGAPSIRNCYNAGEVYNAGGPSQGDVIGDVREEDCENVYSVPSDYNKFAVVISVEELKASDAVERLQGKNVIDKWSLDKSGMNKGMLIPAAQQDMKNGVYKILPDVWKPVTEVNISLSQKEYELKAFSNAYYGLEEVPAVYSSDSDILRITSEGVISPVKVGEATVQVTFEETEYGKKSGFNVRVIITGTKGDVNGDEDVNITDLMMCLYHVSGRNTLTGNGLNAADIDGNGKAELTDLMRILYFVSGRNQTL